MGPGEFAQIRVSPTFSYQVEGLSFVSEVGLLEVLQLVELAGRGNSDTRAMD